MKPEKIILVRHGQSVGNVDKAVYNDTPDYAIPLTPKGKVEASMRGVELKKKIGGESVFAYVSPFRRTRETFQELAGAFEPGQIQYREDPRLREQEWCAKMPLDGYNLKQEEERFKYGHFYYRFDNGESCADVYDRVSDFFNTLHRDFEKPHFPKNCLIISHGMTLRVFLMRWLHMTVEEFELLKNPRNCQAITLLRQSSGKYALAQPLEQHTEPQHPYQFPITIFNEGKI